MENTLAQTVRKVASYILANTPSSIQARSVHNVTQLVANPGIEDRISLDFGHVNSNSSFDRDCDLYVKWERVSEYPGIEDGEGNLCADYQLKAEVNWASFGSSNPELAFRRVRTMQEVCTFAMAIQNEFREPVRLVVRTRKEREQMAQDSQRRVNLARVQSMVANNCKHMKVGSVRVGQLYEGSEVPDDEYVVRAGSGGKQFRVTVTSTRNVCFTRVA